MSAPSGASVNPLPATELPKDIALAINKKLSPAQLKDQEKYKCDLNPELDNGPMQTRGCTDIIFLILYVAFFIAWIVIFIYGVSQGKPGRLLTPFDENGNGCGYSPGYTDYPAIYFYYFADTASYSASSLNISRVYTQTFCLSRCPDKIENGTTVKLKEQGINCKTSNNAVNTNDGRDCHDYLVYNATTWFGGFCVPEFKVIKTVANSTASAASGIYTQLESSQTLERWMNDIKICWWVFIVSFGVALLMSVVYMQFLKWCAGIITWLMLFGLIGVLLGSAFMCWNWAKYKEKQVDAVNDQTQDSNTTAETSKYVTLLKAFAYIFWITGGLMICLIICCYHRIALVIAIIKTTAEFMKDIMAILLVPIINTIVGAGFIAIWIVGTIYLYSVGDVEKRGDFPLAQINWNDNTRRAWYFNLFAILWIIAFILSMEKFVIGASVCIWYFNQTPEGETAEAGQSPVRKSYYWAFRYHLGSIAFGSLILAIVWAIRIMFEYIYHQINNNELVSQNRFVQIGLKCVRCCLDCFERFIRFINKQAFIQIGLTGKNFCSAAKDGFFLVVSHPIEFGLLSGLANLFMILGNLLMMLGTALVAFAIIRNVKSIESNLSSPFWPLLVSSSNLVRLHHSLLHLRHLLERVHGGLLCHPPVLLRRR
jgi:choline transporter-like protein 2/4/5